MKLRCGVLRFCVISKATWNHLAKTVRKPQPALTYAFYYSQHRTSANHRTAGCVLAIPGQVHVVYSLQVAKAQLGWAIVAVLEAQTAAARPGCVDNTESIRGKDALSNRQITTALCGLYQQPYKSGKGEKGVGGGGGE